LSLLEDIAAVIDPAIDIVMQDMTITRSEDGVFNPTTEIWEGGGVVSHPCRGIITDYSTFDKGTHLVEINDRRAIIRQSTLDIMPLTSDVLVVDGKNYDVVRVAEDPAKATWDCQVRS
jgi:hypothetical protein